MTPEQFQIAYPSIFRMIAEKPDPRGFCFLRPLIEAEGITVEALCTAASLWAQVQQKKADENAKNLSSGDRKVERPIFYPTKKISNE